MRSKEEEANYAIYEARWILNCAPFNCKDAKAKVEQAINLFPTLKNGQEMITLCEILCRRKISKSCRSATWWPYTLFQIPTSSTESEANSRYAKLRADLCTLKRVDTLRGTAAAITELDVAMSMCKRNYCNLVDKKKRKAPSPSSDEENTAVSESCSGGDSGGGSGGDSDTSDSDDRDDDPYAARLTPELKKLRQHVFSTLPQQPHFGPLAKYCASVRQEMRSGFDMIFVKLTQKLQNLDGDQILSHQEEETVRGELCNLGEMGYDVIKLRERFDLLVRVKTLAKEDKNYEGRRKNLEGEISAATVQLEKDQRRLSELKSENEVVKAEHYSFKSEMASLKAKLGHG